MQRFTVRDLNYDSFSGCWLVMTPQFHKAKLNICRKWLDDCYNIQSDVQVLV